MKRDNRIDEYIGNAQPYAQPIIKHLRELIHQAVPNIEETIKWNSPHFMLNGKILCSIMAHKNHLTFIFWSGKHIEDTYNLLEDNGKSNMSSLKNIKSIDDLPDNKIILEYIQKAANLIKN